MDDASQRSLRQALDSVRPAPCSVAVMVAGRLRLHHHAAPRPLLPIYSLTKTYLAALTLLAAGTCRLSLNTPVRRFYPDVPGAQEITLRHLLQHTSGLPDYGGLPEYRAAVAGGGAAWPFEVFADHTYRRGLLFPPGRGWAYSNTGYALLAGILEQIWQMPLAELFAQRVAAPLGLDHSIVVHTLDDPRICPSRSVAVGSGGTTRSVNRHYDPGWVWHRLIASDALDSARFLDALLDGRWLGDELTDTMTRLVAVGEPHPPWSEPSYGLGLMGEPAGARGALYGHDGGGPGYTTSAYYAPAARRSVAVIAAAEAPAAVLGAALLLQAPELAL